MPCHYCYILRHHRFTYLEICVRKTCSVGPRGRSWAGLGVASRRSADAVGGSLRAGEEPRWGRGGLLSLGTPSPGSGRGAWPAEPGNCSLRHLSSGWSKLKPSDGWGPQRLEGSLWRPETLSWSNACLQTKTSSLDRNRNQHQNKVIGLFPSSCWKRLPPSQRCVMTKDGGVLRRGGGFAYTSSSSGDAATELNSAANCPDPWSLCALRGILCTSAHQVKAPPTFNAPWRCMRTESADWTRAPANRSPQVPAS